MKELVRRIRAVADYQFGRNSGSILFPAEAHIENSPKTKRIRYVYVKQERLATLRPTDGLFSLGVEGAKRLNTNDDTPKFCVMVQNNVSPIVQRGGDVFAVHVVKADNGLRAGDEVSVINENKELIAVGRAVLCGMEIRCFRRGVAIKTRHGSCR